MEDVSSLYPVLSYTCEALLGLKEFEINSYIYLRNNFLIDYILFILL